VLTTAADGQLKEIHHRRPLAVAVDRAGEWIDTRSPRRDDLAIMGVPARQIVFHPVSAKVSSPRNDGRDLIEEARLIRPEPEPDLFPNPF
jgi:putative SOS response-associated peptidase YedK